MFPQNGPQTGNQFTTSAINQQNNSLLGAPQFQPTTNVVDGLFNNTAPQSSTTNPNVAGMVKALKGGV